MNEQQKTVWLEERKVPPQYVVDFEDAYLKGADFISTNYTSFVVFFDICTTPLVKSITLQEFGKLYNYFFGANIYIEISIMDIFRHSVPIRMSSE